MNLKTRAMLYTAGAIGGSIALSLTLTFIISLITPQQGAWILMAGFVGFFIYISYNIILGQLEHKELLEKMKTSVDK
jgi:zinc transporter ZupT